MLFYTYQLTEPVLSSTPTGTGSDHYKDVKIASMEKKLKHLEVGNFFFSLCF